MAAIQSSDVQFLVNTVALPLQKALTEVILKKPTDPIEYVALYLYAHCGTTRAAHEDEMKANHESRSAKEKVEEAVEDEQLAFEKDQTEAENAELERQHSHFDEQPVQGHEGAAEGAAEAEIGAFAEETRRSEAEVSINGVENSADAVAEQDNTLEDSARYENEDHGQGNEHLLNVDVDVDIIQASDDRSGEEPEEAAGDEGEGGVVENRDDAEADENDEEQ